jgi:predicted nucleic acid-binding protein
VKKRVYIETSIVSYLTAKPSPLLVIAARQEITREWWEQHRSRYDLRVSQPVLDEAGDGDPVAARGRLAAVRGVAVLAVTLDARTLAKAFVAEGLLPQAAATDALHLAMATVHGVDVLLTWNCRHLANAEILGEIGDAVRARGYRMPVVCTPEELMGIERSDNG